MSREAGGTTGAPTLSTPFSVNRNEKTLLRAFNAPKAERIGYARGEAPLGFAEAPEDQLIEYDDEALRHFDEDV